MKSSFYHIQLYVDFANLTFYKNLFSLLGWSIIFETVDTIGFKSESNGDIWLVKDKTSRHQNYNSIGMNHLAIRVEKQTDIDVVVKHIEDQEIWPLFKTPRHRPEFSSEGNTYYQVMFTSSDWILFEIVYVGPKI